MRRDLSHAEETVQRRRDHPQASGSRHIAEPGKSVSQACKQLGVSDQIHYRWRKISGGIKVDHAKHLKELEAENAWLKRAVEDLTVDKLILKEVAEGKY